MPAKHSTQSVSGHPDGVPAEFTDAARGQRLHKYMASCGVASRRECEQMVAEGRVTVNDRPVTALPAWIDPQSDLVRLDGRPLPRLKADKRLPRSLVYVMLHKPRNVITTTDDPQGRRHVTELVDLPPQRHGDPKPRLFPVGRLDADSSGLILMTNDGELAHRLTHPSFEVSKQYEVSIRGRLGEGEVEILRKGLLLAHRDGRGGGRVKRARAMNVRLRGYQRNRDGAERTNLHITLAEGQNREIRRLLARLGFKVRRLKRIAIGNLPLRGLSVGQWRRLTPIEVGKLRRLVGLSEG